MVPWWLMGLACTGHADPAPRPSLTIEGAVLAMDDGQVIEAERVTLTDPVEGQATEVVATDGALRIEAPHTEWNLAQRVAHMSGGVVATRGTVRMECADMVVHFSGPDRVERAVATGDVRVTAGERKATGDRAELTTVDGRITLTGSPTLADGANQMSGDRIILWMDDERVECEGCRMQIDPDALTPALDVDRDAP